MTTKILATFLLFFSMCSSVFAVEVVNFDKLDTSILTKSDIRATELERKLIKKLLNEAEFIQFKDGTSIDLDQLNDPKKSQDGSDSTINNLMKEFMRVESGGGTGAGG
ncbi:MAG: hypothetical protein COW00_18640 [Bdellovibrio sp. CG12_big_fil_rev_8_21_14_0_65_39_13]|nr:MAG: hypothetical protein COW78_15075 [Bdellovibrio sp. CG22_combo_CG10-13_8_21_14_all_39_27]PIQ57856.1 MAG: hypothetical protein COW00_18640 [Bdellovibrio sp. CG12_big_fil_rev_8_21_14_0_65_39_13]PIR32490.1 MAG: hypothetical protein COV37_19640 [Bdellovibrio sp. CG11_big_fil_rev_8_21_14_0_20_39_38]